MAKAEAQQYGDRRSSRSRPSTRIADWLTACRPVWVEGEITELRRTAALASVFFPQGSERTAPASPSSMPRGQFDALRLDLVDGEQCHVYGDRSSSRPA